MPNRARLSTALDEQREGTSGYGKGVLRSSVDGLTSCPHALIIKSASSPSERVPATRPAPVETSPEPAGARNLLPADRLTTRRIGVVAGVRLDRRPDGLDVARRREGRQGSRHELRHQVGHVALLHLELRPRLRWERLDRARGDAIEVGHRAERGIQLIRYCELGAGGEVLRAP